MADRSTLHADCAQCAALCCVAQSFGRSSEFAVDKPAGVPCLMLADDLGCSIHDRLRDSGFPGCTTFDCFGAGQQVVQHTYSGGDWRTAADPGQTFRVFSVMLGLHELLWYLLEARDLAAAALLRDDDPAPVAPVPDDGVVAPARDTLDQSIEAAIEVTEQLTRASAEQLEGFDLDGHRRRLVPLLRRTSELVRAGVPAPRADHSDADLAGAVLRGADLAGADLRNALLLGADLRGADLHLADVTGADLRSADIRGTDLSSVLFATQPQVDRAIGDRHTSLPVALSPPAHWTVAGHRISR